jgi:hypothetical protein
VKVATCAGELFRQLSPKLLLAHYWEILDIIAWRISPRLVKDGFAISHLKEKILEDVKSSGLTPSRQRTCLRSLKVVEEVTRQSVNSGLLAQKGGKFYKADFFDDFFYFLKRKFKKNVKRRIAWALWYFHHFNATGFKTNQLIDFLSYSRDVLLDEIPYLFKRKGDAWLPLLVKEGEKWRLSETPYNPSKPILLLDLHDRLHAAISELSRIKSEFTANEVIQKLRQLECMNIERMLKKIGLRHERGMYYMNDVALKKLDEILSEPVISHFEWPLFGIRPSDNPYFKIEGCLHDAYVDVPNALINQFLESLYELSERYKQDFEKLHKKALKLAHKFNRIFEEQFDGWLSISIRKEKFSTRPLGVKMKINWNSFQKFLEKLAESKDVSFEEKYRYLSWCRSDIAWMRDEPQKRLMEERVRSVSNQVINFIDNTLTSFIERTKIAKKKYRESLLIKRKIRPLLLAYFPEMILTLQTIRDCANKGGISTCYREMRKILESLSWVILDDILLFKEDTLKDIQFVPALRVPTKEWYEWARNKGLIIKSLNDFQKSYRDVSQSIRKRYNIKREELETRLLKNLTYPSFLSLIAIKSSEAPTQVPIYDAEVLRPFIKKDLEKTISQLLKAHLQDSYRLFLDELTK